MNPDALIALAAALIVLAAVAFLLALWLGGRDEGGCPDRLSPRARAVVCR